MKDFNFDPIKEEISKAVKNSLWVGIITGFFLGICVTLLIEVMLNLLNI